MSRKIVGVLLSICLILGVLWGNIISGNGNKVNAAAEYTVGTYKELTYHKYSDHIKITDCNENTTSIAIPDKIGGLPVTIISSYAFNDCSNLVNIAIPNSVTSIGEGAFRNCTGLRSITLPDGITSIAPDTFWCCESLTGITIPDSVTSIGENAFYLCESLTGITLPDSVTSIGENAFYLCKSLTGITLPDSVTSIGGWAFYLCKSLTGITLPDSVTSIGEGAFSGCESLTGITLPDSVTSIGESAFLGCKSLTGITLPDSVTSIGGWAFSDCESLTGITLPDSVTSIGTSAFLGCESLTGITLPDSVTSIGGWAFGDCYNLKKITIPSSVTNIGNSVFYGCNNKLVIICEPGSVVEEYAKEQGIQTGCMHKYSTKIFPATTKQNGSIVSKCSYCGETSTKVINAATTVKLSKTKYTYNGKTHRPKVVVKDREGTVIPASNYTVTYPRSSKNVNKYTVTVTFKGNYRGTKKLTYKIQPRKTDISKLVARKRGFTVKLWKRTKQVTGYQIQYATNKRFQGAKTVTIKKYKTTSKTISRLKAGKKYYVRVRTYKKVKINGKYKGVYADWSKAKTVRTRK